MLKLLAAVRGEVPNNFFIYFILFFISGSGIALLPVFLYAKCDMSAQCISTISYYAIFDS